MDRELVDKCRLILSAHQDGQLGSLELPEDSAPPFASEGEEQRLSFYSLPMALNYRRNSNQLWEAARRTFEDPKTRWVFEIPVASTANEAELLEALTTHSLAIQPHRHLKNWLTISRTVCQEWGSFSVLLASCEDDFLRLKRMVQVVHKRGFPYLAGPKLFNYWSYILTQRCSVHFTNSDLIDIAVDIHIQRCSERLGVVEADESGQLSPLEIAHRWREKLEGSGITPSDLNVPLWTWSRNGFTNIKGL